MSSPRRSTSSTHLQTIIGILPTLPPIANAVDTPPGTPPVFDSLATFGTNREEAFIV